MTPSFRMSPSSLSRPVPLAVLLAAPALAQGENELLRRVEDLEQRNRVLEDRIDILAEENERSRLGEVFVPIGESHAGLGPAASKVYAKEHGLSIGGYGEANYHHFTSGGPDEIDFTRAVLYVGYKFDEHWLLNSEIEFEHVSTEANGAVSVEFAYLDRTIAPEINARAGLVLVPMGFLNELHEPTTYLPATRPETERRIIPSTWSEPGVGVYGDAGPVSYRAYLIDGLDGMGFSASGLRDGRQKGSEALAEDLALVGRVDWTATPGLVAGVSAYSGDAGQGQAGLGSTRTTIAEAHAEWRYRGFRARGLWACAEVDDVAELNAANGFVGAESVGEELEGGYLELGYDVMPVLAPDCSASVSPYVRFETLDTQASVPSGFTSDPANDLDVVSLGVNVMPIDQVVIKLEFQDFDDGEDRINLLLGYVF